MRSGLNLNFPESLQAIPPARNRCLLHEFWAKPSRVNVARLGLKILESQHERTFVCFGIVQGPRHAKPDAEKMKQTFLLVEVKPGGRMR